MNAARSIIAFGDSITQQGSDVSNQGWVALLSALYVRKADVLNRGFSGYNTRWALHLLPQLFPTDSPSNMFFVTIFFGANDSSLMESNPRQHVPIEEYKENLSKIVDHFLKIKTSTTKRGSPEVIIIAPPPIHEDKWLNTCNAKGNLNTTESNRKNSVTGKYAEVCEEVAKQKGVHCINTWNEMQKANNWSDYLSDGLHLSVEGNAFLFQKLKELIVNNIPECDADKLPMYFPRWDEVDINNLIKSIVP